MLETGIKAPEFTLPDQNGEMHTLSDYRGQKVILYFYPKDNTAGCTKQACGFGDRYPQITEKGAVILGVSKDSVASHKKSHKRRNECSDYYSVQSQSSMVHSPDERMHRSPHHTFEPAHFHNSIRPSFHLRSPLPPVLLHPERKYRHRYYPCKSLPNRSY